MSEKQTLHDPEGPTPENFRRILQENDELRAEIERLRRDELTGLLNRPGLAAELAKWKEQSLDDARIAFAYLDLNNFKEINDTAGHDSGDYALKLVATILTTSLRSDDVIARWGGDEIVLALPIRQSVEETDDEDVFYALDDKLNEGLKDLLAIMEEHGEPIGHLRRLGFAIGVKIYQARDIEKGLTELLRDPDQRMYQHKKLLKGDQ